MVVLSFKYHGLASRCLAVISVEVPRLLPSSPSVDLDVSLIVLTVGLPAISLRLLKTAGLKQTSPRGGVVRSCLAEWVNRMTRLIGGRVRPRSSDADV